MSDDHDSWLQSAFGFDVGAAVQAIQDKASEVVADATSAVKQVAQGVQDAAEGAAGAIAGAAQVAAGAVKKVAAAAGGGSPSSQSGDAGGSGSFPVDQGTDCAPSQSAVSYQSTVGAAPNWGADRPAD